MPVTFNMICSELSLIDATVFDCHNAVAFFQPLDVTPLIFNAISPFLMAITILQIVEPLTRIRSTILSKENSFSLKFTINPITFIHISISKYFTALSVEFILLPITFYNGSAFVNQASWTFSLFIEQLSLIHRSVGERDRAFPLNVLFLKFERFYSAVDFLNNGWTMLGNLLNTDQLIARLFICEKKQIDAGLPIYTFARLTVAHSNYNSDYQDYNLTFSQHSLNSRLKITQYFIMIFVLRLLSSSFKTCFHGFQFDYQL